MSDQSKSPETHDSKTSVLPAEMEKLEDQQKLNRVADEAAEQAGKTEQRYDEDNNIFTK